MILFTILLFIVIILLALVIFIASIGGAVGIILCSDLIVCIVFMVLLMRKILKHK